MVARRDDVRLTDREDILPPPAGALEEQIVLRALRDRPRALIGPVPAPNATGTPTMGAARARALRAPTANQLGRGQDLRAIEAIAAEPKDQTDIRGRARAQVLRGAGTGAEALRKRQLLRGFGRPELQRRAISEIDKTEAGIRADEARQTQERVGAAAARAPAAAAEARARGQVGAAEAEGAFGLQKAQVDALSRLFTDGVLLDVEQAKQAGLSDRAVAAITEAQRFQSEAEKNVNKRLADTLGSGAALRNLELNAELQRAREGNQVELERDLLNAKVQILSKAAEFGATSDAAGAVREVGELTIPGAPTGPLAGSAPVTPGSSPLVSGAGSEGLTGGVLGDLDGDGRLSPDEEVFNRFQAQLGLIDAAIEAGTATAADKVKLEAQTAALKKRITEAAIPVAG